MPKSKHRRKGKRRERVHDDAVMLTPGDVCPVCGVTHETLMNEIEHALQTELCPKCGERVDVRTEAPRNGMQPYEFRCTSCWWGGAGERFV